MVQDSKSGLFVLFYKQKTPLFPVTVNTDYPIQAIDHSMAVYEGPPKPFFSKNY